MENKTQSPALKDLVIGIKGGGDLATGIALVLYRAGFTRLFIMETNTPSVIRRRVALASAIYQGAVIVEGIEGIRTEDPDQVPEIWESGKIPVLPDPGWLALKRLRPQVLVDAVIAKKNLGTFTSHADLVIGLGPGFTAGDDVHLVIETQRGHHLGRIITDGSALANTHLPEAVMGITGDRLVRSPAQGKFTGTARIGDRVAPDQILGHVAGEPVRAKIAGVVRGLVHDGLEVTQGRKIGDVDPRGEPGYCNTVSDKARALGGAVLGAVLGRFNR